MDELGHLYRSNDGGQFRTVAVPREVPAEAIAEAPDGGIVVASVRGNFTIRLDSNLSGVQK